MKQRRYDKDFKRDAVAMLMRSGKTATEAGKELGINGNVLASRKQEYLD